MSLASAKMAPPACREFFPSETGRVERQDGRRCVVEGATAAGTGRVSRAACAHGVPAPAARVLNSFGNFRLKGPLPDGRGSVSARNQRARYGAATRGPLRGRSGSPKRLSTALCDKAIGKRVS